MTGHLPIGRFRAGISITFRRRYRDVRPCATNRRSSWFYPRRIVDASHFGLLAAASYSFSDPLVELIALKANAAAAPPSNSATM